MREGAMPADILGWWQVSKLYCKTLSACVKCDDCGEADLYDTKHHYQCRKMDRGIVNTVAQQGFPEWCPLESPGSGVLVFSSAKEDKRTMRCHWDVAAKCCFLTFTNMNDKVVQIGFSITKWKQLLQQMTRTASEADPAITVREIGAEKTDGDTFSIEPTQTGGGE